MSKLKKTIDLFRTEGSAVAFEYVLSYLGFKLLGTRLSTIEDICYRRWRRRHALSPEDLDAMKREAATFSYRPLISVIVPTYNTDPIKLRLAVRSVENQVYTNWELCVADDCSTKSETKAELESLAARGSNIKVTFLKENVGIAGASNAAIKLATGEFVALLDHDDELSPDAFFEVAKLLNEHSDVDMIYTDEDKLDESGRRHIEAFFKPDWSPELLLSNMYTCHLGVYRKSLVDAVGGFRPGFDGAQDYDLVLRLTERTQKIRHIPKVLYHWRRIEGSTSVEYGTNSGGKSAGSASIKALKESLDRRRISGEVEAGLFPGSFRVKPEIPAGAFVSIIVPTRDALDHLRRCVDSIERKSTFANFEIIIVDNRSDDKETLDYLSSKIGGGRFRVIRYDDEFNFSGINNLAARDAQGDYLLFLNNDTEVIEAGWLEALLEPLQIPGVAVTGARLLYPDDTVQHAGIALWHCGTAGHVHSRLPRKDHGYFGAAAEIRNCSAVSAACMMVGKKTFEELGGFDTSLSVSYQDVDFCLRALDAGLRIVYTPFAVLYHRESASTGARANEEEERVFRARWRERVLVDNYYNPNFPVDRLNFRLKTE